MKQLSRIGHTFFIDPDEIPYICLHTFIHLVYTISSVPQDKLEWYHTGAILISNDLNPKY